LTSSQIASEAVLGKPMFGSSTNISSNQKVGSSSTWIIAVAAAVILAGGAGGYWWFSSHKLDATRSNTVSAAAPVTPPSTAPAAAAAPPLAGPTGTTSQPSNTASAKPSSTVNQKPISVPNAAGASSLVAKADKSSAPVDSHRPMVLPSEKIAAPVSHADNSIAVMPAPDVVSKTSSAPGANLSAILPAMGQPSSAPAPPPSRPVGPPAAPSTLQQPKLIQSESPVYPKIAASRGDWGDVIVDATIGENGRVTDAKVVSGPETLRQSALQVVRTQTYKPAQLNGKPVSMHVMVKVPFPKPR
jgi:protein TonB